MPPLKSAIKSSLLQLGAGGALLAHKFKSRNGVVLCPAPVPEANRGDQALLEVAITGLREQGLDTIDLVATSWHPIESVSTNGSVRIIPELYPAFSTPRAFRERLGILKRLIGKRDLVLIGADVLDEGYSVARSEGSLYVLELAARIGVPSRIVSFSINETSSPDLDERLRRVSRHSKLFARDPATFRRLKSAGVDRVVQSGDLAYLLDPAADEDIDHDVLAFVEPRAGRIIGLNLTSVVLSQYGEEETKLAMLAEACARLANEDQICFLLIPHDEPAGVEYLRGFRDRLEQLAPGASWLIDPLPHARELKRITGYCRHLFTCRMHLGIAALGMHTPITCFPYQGKFEGQFELFGLSDDGLVDAADFPPSVDTMTNLMRVRLAQSDSLSETIAERLPHVQALAQRSFEDIGSE